MQVTDPVGNLRRSVYDANGHRTEMAYSQRGDVIRITNANGESLQNSYDALGRLTQVTDALGFQTRYRYDAVGNQTCVIDANALSGSTDPGHQPVNSDGCSESRRYDELNRLIQSTDAQGNSTRYSYDLLGNRTSITDAEGRTTRFNYDDLGRMTQITDPLIETPTDAVETFAYDSANNLTTYTDRKGQQTINRYDRLNRRIAAQHTDGSQETYTYNSAGDLVQVANPQVTYSYSYDAGHRLLSKTDSRLNKTLSWTYDKAGNLNTKTDYQRDTTTYQYDSTDRLVAETNPAYVQVSYHYDGAGRLLDRILSNGAKTQYRYDAGGRLLQLTNTTVTGQVVNDTTYTRDRVGNSLSHTEAAAGQPLVGTTTYTYDPNYRLLRADYPGTANDALYSYDRVGNRLTDTVGSLSANSGTRYYTVNAGNRLTDIRTGSATGPVYESYQYDANGSLTQISGNRNLSLSWDANNRASAISGRTYRYDPADYRIGKGGTGATLNYYLDGEHLDAVYDGGITVQSQHLRGSIIDEVVYSYQRDNTNKLVAATSHHDALQSVLGESNHQGAIQYRQSYTAFGTATNTSQPQRYTGREMDSESGLYYYRARYYDPVIGRFISEDPIGFAGGINQYAYCLNNPVNCNDPEGEIGLFAGALVGAGIDLGLQLALNGGDFSNIDLTSIGVSAALGAVGNVAGGNAARSFLGGLKGTRTKELIGEFGAAIKGLGQGRIPVALQQDQLLSRGKTIVDQVQRSLLNGNKTLVKAKFSTKGRPSLTSQQRLAKRELVPSKGFDFRVVTTTASEFVNAGRLAGSIAGGVTGSALISGINTTLDSINSQITPPILGNISVDFLGFGDDVGAANGGFVLYPNKPNNNTAQAVYRK